MSKQRFSLNLFRIFLMRAFAHKIYDSVFIQENIITGKYNFYITKTEPEIARILTLQFS